MFLGTFGLILILIPNQEEKWNFPGLFPFVFWLFGTLFLP